MRKFRVSGIKILLLLLIIQFTGCKDDDESGNRPPGNFEVMVEVEGTVAILNWTDSIDPDGDIVSYSISVNDKLIIDGLTQNSFTLEELDYALSYTGKVTASDGKGNLTEESYFVKTEDISIKWQVSFGDTGGDLVRAIDQTSSGGVIVAGYSTEGVNDPGMGSDDFRVMKLDKQGNIIWNRKYGGSKSDRAEAIKQTADGGYIVGGRSFSADGDVGGNNGSDDFWILKLSGEGDVMASKNLGGSDSDQLFDIQQLADGGFIAAGLTRSSESFDAKGINKGNSDFWIVKLNSMLNIEWEKNYGGSMSDRALSIEHTADGGFIVAGNTESTDGDVAGEVVNFSGWVIKLNASGELEKQITLGGSQVDWLNVLRQTTDGGFVTVGYSASANGEVPDNNGGLDFWMVKLASSLDVQWNRNFGGSGSDEALSISESIDGGFLLTGYSQSADADVRQNYGNRDFWVVKTDHEGNLLWENNFGGSGDDRASGILQTDNGEVVVAGYSRSSDGDVLENKGNSDFWIINLE